jgi:hypothetical protein
MVQLAEYRSRRKMLVDSWGERDVTTSPRSLRVATTATGPASRARPGAAAPPAPSKSSMPLVIAGLAVIALGGGGWFLFSRASAPPPGATQPAAAPMSGQALAVRTAADEFVARNVWDAASIQTFIRQWQALSPQDRARLADEPAMRSLRYRLDQNIQAEMQLITPDTKPEDRAQLNLLQEFSRALAGETS